VIQAGGDSSVEKLFIFRRQAAAHMQPQVKRGLTTFRTYTSVHFCVNTPGTTVGPTGATPRRLDRPAL
jgi:hypothetical protein